MATGSHVVNAAANVPPVVLTPGVLCVPQALGGDGRPGGPLPQAKKEKKGEKEKAGAHRGICFHLPLEQTTGVLWGQLSGISALSAGLFALRSLQGIL